MYKKSEIPVRQHALVCAILDSVVKSHMSIFPSLEWTFMSSVSSNDACTGSTRPFLMKWRVPNLIAEQSTMPSVATQYW
jgi:hypothetical protein